MDRKILLNDSARTLSSVINALHCLDRTTPTPTTGPAMTTTMHYMYETVGSLAGFGVDSSVKAPPAPLSAALIQAVALPATLILAIPISAAGIVLAPVIQRKIAAFAKRLSNCALIKRPLINLLLSPRPKLILLFRMPPSVPRVSDKLL